MKFATILALVATQASLPGSPIETSVPPPVYTACVQYPWSVVGYPAGSDGALPTFLPDRWSKAALTPADRRALAMVIEARLAKRSFMGAEPEVVALEELLRTTVANLRAAGDARQTADRQIRAFNSAAKIVLPALQRSWRDMFTLDHMTDWRLAGIATWLLQYDRLVAAPVPARDTRPALATLTAVARMPLAQFAAIHTAKPGAIADPLLIVGDPIGEMMVTRATYLTMNLPGVTMPADVRDAIASYFRTVPTPYSLDPRGLSAKATLAVSNTYFLRANRAGGSHLPPGDRACVA